MGAPALFSPEQLSAPRGGGGLDPSGPPPPQRERMARRAREGPAGPSVDAIEPEGAESAVAALDRRLTAALGGEAFGPAAG